MTDKVSINLPALQVRKDDFPDERSYRAMQSILRELKDAHMKMALAVNLLYSTPLGGTAANRPAQPRLFQVYYDVDEGLLVWDGAAWQSA